MSDEQKKAESGPVVSPAVQQAVGLLNLRAADFMNQVNATLKVVLDENAALRAKVLELQVPVKEKAVKP